MRQFNKLVSVASATLLLFSTLAIAQTSPGKSGSEETPDQKEVRVFRLTEAKLDQYQNATKGVVKVLHQHPEIQKKMDQESTAPLEKDEGEVDRSAKSIEAHIEVSGAVKDSGLSVRDYVVMTITLVNSMMLVAMKKQGLIPEYPPSISQGNAAFVEQHYDRVGDIIRPLMESSMPQSDSKDQGSDKKKSDPN
jgi:hypothetical protein